MAIKNFKGDIERNLQEQVAENYRLILEHYNTDRILEDYGIKVIGEATASDLLPDPLTYTGTYGDAYAVGIEPPYNFFVFTRPFEDESDPHWFNLGKLAIQGPAGADGKSAYQLAQEAGFEGTEEQWLASIKGEPGQTGERGSKIYVVDSPINTTVGYLPGDVYIILNEDSAINGTMATLRNGAWEVMGNITGPTGEKGNTGETGTPGDAVRIVGILTSEAQLPAPDSVARDTAYVLQIEGEGQFLYFITGTDNVIWSRVPFENGTTVTVSGLPVQTFDADEYGKINNTATYARIPSIAGTNTPDKKINEVAAWLTPDYTLDAVHSLGANNVLATYSANPINRNIGDDNPRFLWTSSPSQDFQCANKKYVDTNFQTKLVAPTAYNRIPTFNDQGQITWYYRDESLGTVGAVGAGTVFATYRLPTSNQALGGRVLLTDTPKLAKHCANKAYVDCKGYTFASQTSKLTLDTTKAFVVRTYDTSGFTVYFADGTSVANINILEWFGGWCRMSRIADNTHTSNNRIPSYIANALSPVFVEDLHAPSVDDLITLE